MMFIKTHYGDLLWITGTVTKADYRKVTKRNLWKPDVVTMVALYILVPIAAFIPGIAIGAIATGGDAAYLATQLWCGIVAMALSVLVQAAFWKLRNTSVERGKIFRAGSRVFDANNDPRLAILDTEIRNVFYPGTQQAKGRDAEKVSLMNRHRDLVNEYLADERLSEAAARLEDRSLLEAVDESKLLDQVIRPVAAQYANRLYVADEPHRQELADIETRRQHELTSATEDRDARAYGNSVVVAQLVQSVQNDPA